MTKRKFKKVLSLFLAVLMVLGTFNFPMAEAAPASTLNHLIISQVYGGGGNSGAVYTHDFIELYNPTDSEIDLSNYSLQYVSEKGTGAYAVAVLKGKIGSKAFYTFQAASGAGNGIALPKVDDTITLSLGGSGGKVALVEGATAIVGNIPNAITSVNYPTVVDFVGYGSAASQFEGTGPAATLSNSTAAKRIDETVDNNDNKTEFVVAKPEPRSGVQAPPTVCETPMASLPAGPVLPGTVVNFTTTTSGAAIQYNAVSATAPDSDWTTGNAVTIAQDVTYYVRAIRADLANSLVASFAYTVDSSSPVPISTAKDATVGTPNLKVQGVVTYISGANVYIQDETGAICLFLKSAATRLKVGDKVTALGKRATYNGLVELDGIYESTVQVVDQNVSIPALRTAKIADIMATPAGKTVGFNYMCEIVNIEGVTMTADANGAVNFITQSGASVKVNPAVNLANFAGIAIGDTVNAKVRVSAVNSIVEVAVLELAKAAVVAPLEISANYKDIDVVTGATITLSANDTAAKIYYTLDGSEPTASSTAYANGIKLTGNVGDKIVLKAIAKAEGKADSVVFTSTYTIKAADPAMTIKEALAAPVNSVIEVKGTLSYVATSYGNPVIQSIIDGKTYALYIVDSVPTGAKIGDEVSFKGTYVLYKGLPELKTITASKILGVGQTIPPTEMTIAEIKANGPQLLGRIVKIKNATLGTYDATGSTPITQGTDKIDIYKAINYPIQVVAGEVADVTAMVACFNTTIQLYTGTNEANGFNVYDVVNDTKTPVVTLSDSYLSAKPALDYTFAVKAEDNKGMAGVTVTYTIGAKTVADQPMVYSADTQDYRFTVPAAAIGKDDKNIVFTVKAKDVTGLETISAPVTITIDGAPQINAVMPARNGATGDNKAPEIAVTLGNYGVDPVVTLTLKQDATVVVDAKAMTKGATGDTYSYQTSTLADGLYTATVNVLRADGQVAVTTWSFTVGTPKLRAFFGQLHAHTAQYSDGSGTLLDGLNYISSLAESENVDFVSFTDHSNFFDTETAANPAEALNDTTKMTAASLNTWNSYVNAMKEFNAKNVGKKVAMPGFEMTWSGNPGHINTFNSKGLVSRNNTILNNKTSDLGMKAYYETLIQNTDPMANLSQFNHPGTAFGTFSDFAYWSEAYDNKMVAVEVGNGDGAIGSGGYFTSFKEYTKALDKGWKVAPTSNQDNHKGKWGNANTARTVIITDTLSTDGLMKGLKNMSVYATEDKNLSIQYTVNDQIMGSSIAEVTAAPLKFNVSVYDPDASDAISKIEIITNSGRTVQAKAFTGNDAQWQFELPAVQGYYYVRVTQADKNVAVTAPVWVGQAPLVGISSVATDTKMPVTGEALTIHTKVFNNETTVATLKSVTYSIGDQVIGQETPNTTIPTSGQITHAFAYTPAVAGLAKVTATVVLDLNGQEKTFYQEVTLNVRDASKLVNIGIDASHFNEYVAGNYKDAMGNFAAMAVELNVRVVELKTSEALIAATEDPKYRMLILTPPSRRDGTALRMDYRNYNEAELAAIKSFAEKGNTLVVTTYADSYEKYTKYTNGTAYTLPLEHHMAAQQNKILSSIGSSLRVSDDAFKDKDANGTLNARTYLKNYNLDNIFNEGVKPLDQVYSQYGGSTIHAVDASGTPTATLSATVSPIVYGFETGTSSDEDITGTTAVAGVTVPKYDNKHLIAASEQIKFANGKTATIIVAGATFMSNFEIQATTDFYAVPTYSNYTIAENLIKFINPQVITPIAELHKAAAGETFNIRGIVTSNASGFDKETAFFDCVYVQDETGGINAFPVAGAVKAGQTVQITGKTSAYNGERQIAVEKITIIDATVKPLPEPRVIIVADAKAATYLGQLVKLSGIVTKIDVVNGAVESIFVKPASGTATGDEVARIFIDGYITKDKTIANLEIGSPVTAVGLQSFDTEGARVRIRDRADIVSELPALVSPVITVTAPKGRINADIQKDFSVELMAANLDNVSALSFTFNYDKAQLKLKDVVFLSGANSITFEERADGQVKGIIGFKTPVTAKEATAYVKFVFEPAMPIVTDANLQVSAASFTDAKSHREGQPNLELAKSSVNMASYRTISDLSGDGKISLADLSIAMPYYVAKFGDSNWAKAKAADLNGDGIVDMTDYTILATFILRP